MSRQQQTLICPRPNLTEAPDMHPRQLCTASPTQCPQVSFYAIQSIQSQSDIHDQPASTWPSTWLHPAPTAHLSSPAQQPHAWHRMHDTPHVQAAPTPCAAPPPRLPLPALTDFSQQPHLPSRRPSPQPHRRPLLHFGRLHAPPPQPPRRGHFVWRRRAALLCLRRL